MTDPLESEVPLQGSDVPPSIQNEEDARDEEGSKPSSPKHRNDPEYRDNILNILEALNRRKNLECQHVQNCPNEWNYQCGSHMGFLLHGDTQRCLKLGHRL